MDNNDSKPQQTGGLKLMTVFIAVLALHVLVIGGFTVYHLMGSSGGDADLTLDKNHKLRADGTVVTDTTTPDASAPDKTADATASTDTATGATGTATAASTAAPDTSVAATDTATPTSAPVANPAPAPTVTQVAANPPTAPAPATPAATASSSPIVLSGDDMSQTSTIPAGLAPPADATPASSAPPISPVPVPSSEVAASVPSSAPVPTPAPSAISSATPSGPVTPVDGMASGPVHMPAIPPAPTVASSEEHVSAPAHEEHALASAHESKKEIYTVKITDSYQKIAHAHHITVAELKAANHIKGNIVLRTGQKLIIPLEKTSVARSGASHDDGTAEATASTASLSASPTSSAKTHHHYYTVAKGDTLKKIARKFDVTASALKEANNLSGTKLAVGEKLRIPSHTRATAGIGNSSASLTDRVAAPVAVPSPIPPSQVETQPAPVEQPAPTPMANPAPEPAPASNPELTSLNF